MERLHALVVNIQALSNADDLSHLHQLLKQAEQSLKSHAAQLAGLLSELDPAQHSLGYLYILDAYTSGPKTEVKAGEHVSTVVRFIDSCVQDQIHLAPEKFVSVCKKFKDDVMMLYMPIRGVAPMRTAVRKLQSSSGHLTTLHPEFLLLCLLAKCYKVGYSILEEDIFEIDHPKDVYLYCYYGGMICIGQKCFRKAMELLHMVVTAPMPTMSAIVVEAHRKYILVSLIQNGQHSDSFSKSSSIAMTAQTLKHHSEHYYDLANSYSTGNISQLESCLQTNRAKFEREKNLGLVKQVVASMHKRSIQRLTQTYLTLSLQDIANTAQLKSPNEAEMLVLQMIQDGEIHATINQKDGMVNFLEDPEQYKTCSMGDHIDSSIQRIMSLSKKLSAVDEFLSYDPSYLTKVGKGRSSDDLYDFDAAPHRFGRDRSRFGHDDFEGVPSSLF